MGRPPGGESNEVLGALSPNSAGTSVNAEADNKLSDDLNELVLTPIPELGIQGRRPPVFSAETGAGALPPTTQTPRAVGCSSSRSSGWSESPDGGKVMQHLPRTAQKFFCMGALWWIAACPRAATPVLVAPPQDTGALGPTLVAVEGDVARFPLQTNANACKSCHAEQAEGWRKSMHAFSSFNNPFYRFNFDAYVQEKGHSKGPFCAGCHDPNPLLASELGQPVQPDAPHAHAGIGCVVCHLTQKASPNGNGSYVLKSESLLIPKAGDDASVQAHRAQMDGPRRLGNALCVSCHRGFLSPETGHDLFIPALEDWVPFRHSGYHAQKATRVDAPLPPHQCITCHMPPQENTDGKVTHDHASAGGHTAFSRLAEDKIQTKKMNGCFNPAPSFSFPSLVLTKSRACPFSEVYLARRDPNLF